MTMMLIFNDDDDEPNLQTQILIRTVTPNGWNDRWRPQILKRNANWFVMGFCVDGVLRHTLLSYVLYSTTWLVYKDPSTQKMKSSIQYKTITLVLVGSLIVGIWSTPTFAYVQCVLYAEYLRATNFSSCNLLHHHHPKSLLRISFTRRILLSPVLVGVGGNLMHHAHILLYSTIRTNDGRC